MIDPKAFRKGQMYKVRYQIPGVHRVPREMVAKFIDADGDKLFFSGRPQHGTSECEASWIIAVWTTTETECYSDRKVPSEIRTY
jgi:hypothetical protein